MAKYRIFKVNESDNDMAFENGDFVFVEDREAVRQQVLANLNHSLGDYFLNLEEGINYAGEGGIMGARRVTTDIEAQFIEAITNTFGVVELRNIDFPFENNTLEVNAEYVDEFSDEIQTINFTPLAA